MIYLLLLLASLSLQAMEQPITILDNTGAAAAITDPATFAQLQKLSGALAGAVIGTDNTVATPLKKSQINFLLQLNANKAPNVALAAIKSHKIDLTDMTHTDVQNLQLSGTWNKFFDNLILIKIKIGENTYTYLPLRKAIATHFFSTIKHISADYGDPFFLFLDASPSLIVLYDLVKPLVISERPLSLAEWEQYKNKIKQSTLLANTTTEQLLKLLEAANFLGAKPYLLAALLELYKTYFPTEDDWDRELQVHPVLGDIEYEVITKFSIGHLVRGGKKDLYSIQKEKSRITDQEVLAAHIHGSTFNSLKGLNTIPDITKCDIIYIENTNITALRFGDLRNLQNLKELYFYDNARLRHLEKNSLRLFDLRALTFRGNNIDKLTPGVFILNSLRQLEFRSNNIQIIESDWAKSLPNLSALTIDEPLLKTIEKGWLNGLTKLRYLELSPAMDKAVVDLIKQDIAGYKEPLTLLMPGEL